MVKARTRRKVYFLLPAGHETARRMRDHAKIRRVVLVDHQGSREVAGADAIDILRRRGAKESEAFQRVLVDDLIELVEPEAPRPVEAPRAPFFGREAELRALRAWRDQDVTPVAAVIGVAGIGKSALLAKFLSSESRPVFLRRLYAHDDAHGLLSSMAEFLAKHGRRRLKAILMRAAYDPTEAVAVARDDLAGSLLAFDDLQTSPAAESLLKSLLEGRPRWKLLVASRTQPMFYDRAAIVSAHAVEIPLDGLADGSAIELLASRRVRLRDEEQGRVLRAARGHPLALEMFASSGFEAGDLETRRYIVDTVLEGLDAGSERLLRAFAVLRRPAPSPETLGATFAHLRKLVRRALLMQREDGYLLHDLVKEFFQRHMTSERTRVANERAARYWEGRGDLLEGAYHRLEAGDMDRAVVLLTEGGERHSESGRAGDLEACLLRLPRERRPRSLLAQTQMFLGKFLDAQAVLEEAVREGSASDRLRARIQLGRIETRLGNYGRAQKLLEEAAGDAASESRQLEGEALRALGGVERRLGEVPRAIDHLTRAVSLLDDATNEKVRGLTDLAAALIVQGHLEASKVHLVAAARLAKPGSREEAAIENNLAIVLSREGSADDAAKAFARSAEIATGTGEIRFASYALANAVENYLVLNDLESASSCAERALALAETVNDPVALSTARANLGLVLARRGDWTRAEEHLLGSVELIARLNNPYSLAMRYEEIAKVYAAQGRTSDAATWRHRADDLYARLRDVGPSRAPQGRAG